MKEIHQHQREWLNKWTDNRFVFVKGPEAPTAPVEAQEEKIEAKPTVKPAEILKPEDFDGHVKQFQGRLNHLKKAYQKTSKLDEATETKNLGEIDSEFAKINEGYQARMRILEKNYNTQVEAQKQKYEQAVDKVSQKFTPKIQELIKRVEGHITEVGPISAETAEEKAQPEGAERSEAKEGAKKTTKLTPALKTKALDLIGEQFKQAKNPVVRAMIEHDIGKLDFSDEQIKQLASGKLELSDKQEGAIRAILPKVRKYDPKRGQILHQFLTGSESSDLEGDAAKMIEGLFDSDDDPLRMYLTKRYAFKAVPKDQGGGIKILNDDGKEEHIAKLAQLSKYLPQSARADFEAILNPKEGADLGKLQEQIQTVGKEELKNLAVIEGLQDQLLDPKNMEKPGFMGSIGMLLALWKSIMEAINSDPPDMTTLNEFLEDWTETKSPKGLAGKIGQSKEGYNGVIDALKNNEGEPHSLNDLLQAYLNPREKEADTLFGVSKVKGRGVPVDPKHPMARHRNQAKPAIKDYIQSKMEGVKIADIEKGKGDAPKLIIYVGTSEQPLEVRIGQTTAEGTQVSVIKKIPGKKAGETEEKENTGTIKSMKELAQFIKTGSITRVEAPPKPPKGAKKRPEARKAPEITDKMRQEYVEGLNKKQIRSLIQELTKDPAVMKDLKAFYRKEKPAKGDSKAWAEFRKNFILNNMQKFASIVDGKLGRGERLATRQAKKPKKRPGKLKGKERLLAKYTKPGEQFAIEQAYSGQFKKEIGDLIKKPKSQREGKNVWQFVHDEMTKVTAYKDLADKDKRFA